MRVLAIVYCYPPLLVPAAICYMKILMGLERSGVDVEILHIDPETFQSPTGFVQLDPELAAESPESIARHEVRSLETTPWVRLVKRLDPDRRFCYRWLEPKKREWTYPAMRRLKELDLRRFDVLLTCSQPHTNHLLGLELREQTDLPWVAYFSDPWTDSPYIHYGSERVRRYNRQLEDEILTRADRVLYTCDEMRRLVVDNHAALAEERSGVLPHAFVPPWYQREIVPEDPSNRPRLRLLHTGSFYGPRTPQPLIDSIVRISRRLNRLPDLRVDIYGGVGDEHRKAIEAAGLSEIIVLHGMVPYFETLSLMKRSSGLLLVDAPLSSTAESVFLPSKLIDYLGSGKPILAVTPQSGAVARVVRETGGIVCALERPEELDEALLTALAAGALRHEPQPEAVSHYDYDQVGGRVRELLTELVDVGSHH